MAVVERTWTIEAKGVGLPDYAAPKPTGQVAVGPTYTVTDIAEGAARLGSIVTYDRRGNVVIFDDFEGPVLRWRGETPTGLTYARLDSENVKSGSQAVRLHTADLAGQDCQIFRVSSVLASRRVGHELSFSAVAISLYFHVWISYWDGTHWWEGEARIDRLAQELQLETAVGVYTTIANTGPLNATPFTFYTLKVVVDFDTLKYIRLLFGPNEYDISTHDLVQRLSPQAPSIGIGVWIQNMDAVGGDAWVDDSIFTQNEPLNVPEF